MRIEHPDGKFMFTVSVHNGTIHDRMNIERVARFYVFQSFGFFSVKTTDKATYTQMSVFLFIYLFFNLYLSPYLFLLFGLEKNPEQNKTYRTAVHQNYIRPPKTRSAEDGDGGVSKGVCGAGNNVSVGVSFHLEEKG